VVLYEIYSNKSKVTNTYVHGLYHTKIIMFFLIIMIFIVNFLFGVYISQLIRYSRDCACNHDYFLDSRHAAGKEFTQPRVVSGNVDVITWNVLRSM